MRILVYTPNGADVWRNVGDAIVDMDFDGALVIKSTNEEAQKTRIGVKAIYPAGQWVKVAYQEDEEESQ